MEKSTGGRPLFWPLTLVTSLFFMWGLANNMTDTLLAAFKKIMSMTDFQTSWIQVAFYGSYFCLALPAALYIKRFTYKSGVLLGLGLFIMGGLLFYPASNTREYSHFLIALFVLAGGLSILETAANPYIIAMGPEESGTVRLNFAQSFNPIGSITGVLLSKLFILSHLHSASTEQRASMDPTELDRIQSAELSAVMGPYVGVAAVLVVLWGLIYFTKMPKASDAGSAIQFGPTFGRLFRNPQYVWGVIAQFFYVGAQIGVWSFTIRYVMLELNLDEDDASSYYLAALVLFTISRFICTFLMRFTTPQKLLGTLSILAVVLSAVVAVGDGYVGVYALVGISGCMSLMFPTIFGLAVRGLGHDTKLAGSGLIMAILGGAVVTAIQGQVSDGFQSIHASYVVPLLCFVVVGYYAYFVAGKSQA